MLVRCIDFETAGTDPDEIVEIGWQDVAVLDLDAGEGWVLRGDGGQTFAEPGVPMAAPARGVHHITPAMLAGAPARRDAIKIMVERDGIPNVFCAHEARFERGLWSTEKRPWICTRKAALRIWPDAPDHKLQTLRYWLDLCADPQRAWPPHRAQPDAYVGALVLLECLRHASAEQMIEWTEKPSLLPTCPLNKHKGKRWEDVPSDYLEWMLRTADMDADLHYTARHHLEARRPQRGY